MAAFVFGAAKTAFPPSVLSRSPARHCDSSGAVDGSGAATAARRRPIAITLYREHVIVRVLPGYCPASSSAWPSDSCCYVRPTRPHSRDWIGLILVVSAAGELYRRRRSALVELPAVDPIHRSPP